MIGRRCKAGDSLSRAALIARALTRRIPAGAVSMCLAGATQLRSIRISGPASSLCGPQGTRNAPPAWEARNRHKTSAAHRSAAMAGGARPDPFRTRKLSRRAPMVLRGKPVGEQGAADRWTALDPFSRARARGRRGGIPLRGAPFLITQSCFRGPPYFLCNGRCGGLFLCSPSSGPCAPSAPSSRDGAARCPAAFPLAGISPPLGRPAVAMRSRFPVRRF